MKLKYVGMIMLMLVASIGIESASAAPINDLLNYIQNVDLPKLQWYSPTNEYTLDSEGLHFYSGSTGSITWYLANSARTDIDSKAVSGIGYYTFALPAQSGDYLLYCKVSGCESGDWIRIDLSNIPASPSDTVISGDCSGSPCKLPSKNFPYMTGMGTPANYYCNTCSPRDVNKVPGVNTAAIVIPTPPVPTATSWTPEETPTQKPVLVPPAISAPPVVNPLQTNFITELVKWIASIVSIFG